MVRTEYTVPGWEKMWHPLSILFRVSMGLPSWAVLATGMYLLSVLPDGIHPDDQWEQHPGWPDPVPPAWPYWIAIGMAIGGFIGSFTWNGRSILRDPQVVGGAFFVNAFLIAVFATKFPGVEAWPHSLVWAAPVFALMSAAGFFTSMRESRRAAEAEAAAAAEVEGGSA
ncbi:MULTISPECIES: hypothetical protein [Curtobacterium]|uniref:hypothetical protein n=1 Tax=Curtobacterium flaccumfaciens TaxID=2035 RepID=UPI003EE79E30